jgi:hypothetical protein
LITGILAVNPTVGTDGSNTVTVEVIVLEVGFALAGEAKLATNAKLEIATSKVLSFLFMLRPTDRQFN